MAPMTRFIILVAALALTVSTGAQAAVRCDDPFGCSTSAGKPPTGLSIRAAKAATRAAAENVLRAKDRDGAGLTGLNSGPVCKRLARKAMRCGYRINYSESGDVLYEDHHVLVTLSYGYAITRDVGPTRTYVIGFDAVPRLRP